MKTLAGIITFNPNIDLLKRLLQSIIKQVDEILIVDNFSKNIADFKMLNDSKITFIYNSENKGVAYSLNQIFLYGIDHKYSWILTLDQDSLVKDGLILRYIQQTKSPNIGIITCNIVDRNTNLFIGGESKSIESINFCISSGSFCSTKCFKEIGGFDSKMFIDGVDFDYCLNTKKHKFSIIRINWTGISHEIGNTKVKYLFFKKCLVFNESAIRHYYMARNQIYLLAKYPDCFSKSKEALKEVYFRILILLFEKDKLQKLNARRKGVKDGKAMAKQLIKEQLGDKQKT